MNKKEMEHCIEEVMKCKCDPIYFIEQCLNWRLTDPERSMIKQIHESTGVSMVGEVVQSRWLLVAYALWGTVFNGDVQYGFICDDKDRISSLKQLYLELHDSLPQWMTCEIHTCNQHVIGLINNSTIQFIKNVNHTRGMGFNTVIVSCHDEKMFDELKQALYPVISSRRDGKIIEWID